MLQATSFLAARTASAAPAPTVAPAPSNGDHQAFAKTLERARQQPEQASAGARQLEARAQQQRETQAQAMQQRSTETRTQQRQEETRMQQRAATSRQAPVPAKAPDRAADAAGDTAKAMKGPPAPQAAAADPAEAGATGEASPKAADGDTPGLPPGWAFNPHDKGFDTTLPFGRADRPEAAGAEAGTGPLEGGAHARPAGAAAGGAALGALDGKAETAPSKGKELDPSASFAAAAAAAETAAEQEPARAAGNELPRPAELPPATVAPHQAGPSTLTEAAAETPPPAPAAAPFEAHLVAALDSPAFAPALGAQVSMLVRDGIQEARLQLNPADMGPINVQIELQGNQAHVEFSADLAATRSALEASLPDLAAALNASGLTLAGGGVFEQARERLPQEDTQPAPGVSSRGSGSDGPDTLRAAAPRITRGLVDMLA
jgi:flagellar hook-length control protein FliK